MFPRALPWALLFCPFGANVLAAAGGDVKIPVTNRPANFSGAAGVYRIEVHASPALEAALPPPEKASAIEPTTLTVQVEDPIDLSVKIISLEPGPVQYPPQRDKLRILPPDIETKFFVEPLPEQDRFLASQNAWEFNWRLVPKRVGLTKIPALEFVYYHTSGAARFTAADGAKSITLDVKPRPELLLAAPAGTRDKFQLLALGANVLTRSPTPRAFFAMVAAGLLLPPLLCMMAYVAWWRFFPDAAERLRRRRSRALRTALAQLRKLGPSAPAGPVRETLGTYLQLRLEMPPGEPTPLEVRNALRLRGLDGDLVSQTERLLQTCDTALFAPGPQRESSDFTGEAAQLLRCLEDELCRSPTR